MVTTFTRRAFLKFTALAGPFLFLLGKVPKLFGGPKEHNPEGHYWKNGMFKQDNVDTSQEKEGIIKAKFNGAWHTYQTQSLPPAFLNWNFSARIKTLEEIKEGKPPSLAGPHNGAVATYGGRRLDSQVSINNAIKGMGFAPKEERIKETSKKLKETISQSQEKKLEILKSFYQERENLFDTKKQVSLELYTSPEFETHTFLNLMENPVASVVFLDFPCFELRTVVRLVHPKDTSASRYERHLLEYTNLVHSYFHGEFKEDFIAMIFHLLEVFDNSPGKKRGIRIVPVE
ncbi:MAG: hypothetical protein AB1393_00980 [Candidatus Edwardsbacteria bacterium]